MTEWKVLSNTHFIHFSRTHNHPAKILCPNETHIRPLGIDICAETFPVMMEYQKWVFGTESVHVYTGSCPSCGGKYIYTPDATPDQIETITQEMEKTR